MKTGSKDEKGGGARGEGREGEEMERGGWEDGQRRPVRVHEWSYSDPEPFDAQLVCVCRNTRSKKHLGFACTELNDDLWIGYIHPKTEGEMLYLTNVRGGGSYRDMSCSDMILYLKSSVQYWGRDNEDLLSIQ